MHLLSYAAVLVTMFVSLQAEYGHNDLSDNVFLTSENFKKVNCRSQGLTSLRSHESYCRPRETLVNLISGATNMMTFPSKVWVQRCDGRSCHGYSSCVPTEIEKIPFKIHQRSFNTNRETCGEVMIEQHKACSCNCTMKAFQCSPKQFYNQKDCACQCINRRDERKCSDQGKDWDPKTCSCNCKEKDVECTTGSEWVESYCRCVRIPSMNYAEEQFYDESKYE